jgi:peptidoglycan/LPS O-acetylase OafA/YrhL
MEMKQKFRSDIQGLRALAVLAVVIFHISPHRLPGGYLGVDIFFVISGYLIIGFICRDLKLNQFSFIGFYAKRFKRLFPALFVTCLVSALFSYIYLLPQEFASFIKSLIATLTYVSNFYFYSQTDYFDESLKLAPLLHTWSLSVEEQFYFLFPPLLYLIFRLFRNKNILILSILGIASFVLSEWLLHINSSLSFFISPSRFWQFIVGGILALQINKIPINPIASNISGGFGIIGLTISFFLYTESTLFPGINALVPTLLTLLVLYAGNIDSFYTRVMSIKPNIAIGDASYSIYLWHWPLIVFYKLALDITVSTAFHNFMLLFLSLILGFCSYRLIETPFKNMSLPTTSARPIKISIGLSLAAILLAILGIQGAPNRFPEQSQLYAKYINYKAGKSRVGECFIGSSTPSFDAYSQSNCITNEDDKYNIAIVGDSFAAHWYSAMNQKLSSNSTLTQFNSSGCLPVVNSTGLSYCTELMKYFFDVLAPKILFDKIIISARWKSNSIDSLVDTIQFLTPFADHLVVIGPAITYKIALPRILAFNSPQNLDFKKYSEYEKFARMDAIYESRLSNLGVEYVSIFKATCSKQMYCETLTKQGIPIAFDYGHMTHEGAIWSLETIFSLKQNSKFEEGFD